MLSREQAEWLLEVLTKTQGLSLPTADRKRLRLAADTIEALEKLVTETSPS
jgi:hypothetical protein